MEYKFEKLNVWKSSLELSKLIYDISKNFPKEERFALTSQIRRAVTSINLNIVEGSMRNSSKEFKQFIRIAIGSLVEVKSCLKLAFEFEYIKNPDIADEMLDKTYFMLLKLEKSLHTNNSNISNISNKYNHLVSK